eukprot:TRINITY_DN2166_c0_g2_i1.p1 TRINITY_DN2166_c0_g2~~TRINITY_DN2166_c0_g2_i1.p1  ORF type:complete len:1878 (+),score=408.31 TRINITY_DN2166_c0_g2_i1:386-6019(+)
MSPQQSKPEKSESQFRKSARSSGHSQHQQASKGSEAGASASQPPSGRSGKRSNGPSGQLRGNATNFRSQHEDHTQRQPCPGNTFGSFESNINPKSYNGGNMQGKHQAKQPSVPPKSNGILPRPPLPQPSNTNASEKSSMAATGVASGENSKDMTTIQFGSFICDGGFQVPARTSSAPPNISEQKQDQARFAAANDPYNLKASGVQPGSHQKQEDQASSKKDALKLESVGEDKKGTQGVRSGSVVQAQSVHMPGIPQSTQVQQLSSPFSQIQSQSQQFGTQSLLSNNLHSQGMIQVQQVSGLQTQLQQPVYGLSAPLQQGMIPQIHGLNYAQAVHTMPHLMPQVNSSTAHISSSQFPINSQIPFQVNHQLPASIPNHVSSFFNPASMNTYYHSSRSSVTIRRPDTHEEIIVGRKTKNDSQADNNTSPALSTRTAAAIPAQGNTVSAPSNESTTAVSNKKIPMCCNGPAPSSIQQLPKPVESAAPQSSVQPSRLLNVQAKPQSGEKLEVRLQHPNASLNTSMMTAHSTDNQVLQDVSSQKECKSYDTVESSASRTSVVVDSVQVQQLNLHTKDFSNKSVKPEQKGKKKHKQQQSSPETPAMVDVDSKQEAVLATSVSQAEKLRKEVVTNVLAAASQKTVEVFNKEEATFVGDNTAGMNSQKSSVIDALSKSPSTNLVRHNKDSSLGAELNEKTFDQKPSISEGLINSGEMHYLGSQDDGKPLAATGAGQNASITSKASDVLKISGLEPQEQIQGFTGTKEVEQGNAISQLQNGKCHMNPSENKITQSPLSASQVSCDSGDIAEEVKMPRKGSEVIFEPPENEVNLTKADDRELVAGSRMLNLAADTAGSEDKASLSSHSLKVETKQSSIHRSKSKDRVQGEGSAHNEKFDYEKDREQNPQGFVAMGSCQPLHSTSLNENEEKADTTVKKMDKEIKHSLSSVTRGVEMSKTTNKKKKKKECLTKADATPTSSLYDAYEVPKEKREVVQQEPCNVVTTSNIETQPSVELEKEGPKEVDDWEDDTELLPTVNLPKPELASVGKKKYSRDFLLTLKEQCRQLPTQFDYRPEVMEVLVNSQCLANMPRDGEMFANGRMLDRQTSGGRRANNLPGGDDDRWVKPMETFAPGLRVDGGLSGPAGGFRPGQSYNSNFGRNMRNNPMNFGGILPGSSSGQTAFPSGGLTRNNSDADRWQRSPATQKGLIPPPHYQLPSIHKTENPYEVGKVIDEEQSKQRQIKAILNKLTPQNFEKLFVKVSEVNIDSATCLTGVISQIFDKALMEPTFCEMYARFCKRLAQELPEFHENNEKVVFKRVLLNKCQEEFERNEREQEEADKDDCGDKKFSEEEKAEKKAAARRRMLGNIRFIGELYKEQMLTERIMHECIRKLLGEFQKPDEENVEALCKLMTTIGHMIDHKKAKDYIDAYFDRMASMSENHLLPSRLRFMLKDVIDLRKNGWQQRRKVEGPKTIDEVHRDAVQEKHGIRNRGVGPGHSGRRIMTPPDHGTKGPVGPPYTSSLQTGSSQSMAGGRGTQSHMGTRGGISSQDARITDRSHYDSRPFSNSLPPRSIDDITLGPQGGLGRGMTGRGQSIASNRPDIASGASVNNKREVVGPLTRGSSDRPLCSAKDGSSTRTQIAEKPLQTSTSNRHGFDSDVRESRFSRPTTIASTHDRSSPRLTSPQLSEEKLKERSEMAIKEFYSVGDIREVVLCVEELKAPAFHPTMVSNWIIDSFDRKDREREQLASLLIHFCNAMPSPLNKQQLLEGLEILFSILEDATCDAPKATEFLGRILGKLVMENVLKIHDIAKVIKESRSEGEHSFDVIGTILQVIKTNRGENHMSEMYRNSGVMLEAFLPSGWELRDFETFLDRKDIQCLHPTSISRNL